MTTIQKLTELGFTEGVDYLIENDELVAIEKVRLVDSTIRHQEVPEVRGPSMDLVSPEVKVDGVVTEEAVYIFNPNALITPAILAYSEVVKVEQKYFEKLPTMFEVKMQCIPDLALAVGEYLSDKKHLVDSDNDSVNICDGKIVGFHFKNIAHPNINELLSCYNTAKNKLNQIETNRIAQQYLDETDKYVIRFMETGTPMPAGMQESRAAARLGIVK